MKIHVSHLRGSSLDLPVRWIMFILLICWLLVCHRFEPRVVSHLYTWQDSRCSPEFLASLPTPRSHQALATGYGCPTLLWFAKYRPHELSKSAKIIRLLSKHCCDKTCYKYNNYYMLLLHGNKAHQRYSVDHVFHQ